MGVDCRNRLEGVIIMDTQIRALIDEHEQISPEMGRASGRLRPVPESFLLEVLDGKISRLNKEIPQ